MATSRLCCPPPGPGAYPHPIPETREPCDTHQRVYLDECTQNFITADTNRVLGALDTHTDEIIAAIEAQTAELADDAAGQTAAVVAAIEEQTNLLVAAIQVPRLLEPGAAHSLDLTGDVDVTQVLTSGYVSLHAVGGPVRYAFGAAADPGTSHYLADGERVDVRVPSGASLHAIRATGSAATTLEVSELG